jgi:hypothetical protein
MSLNECPTCHRPFLSARTTDPDTSALAGEAKTKREGATKTITPNSDRHLLLRHYDRVLARSDFQVASYAGLTSISGNCWWKRCSELRQGGYIKAVGAAVGSNGREVTICILTPKGAARKCELEPLHRG